MIEAPEDQVFAGGLERAWIDDRVPGRRARDEALRRHALRLGARASRAVPHRVLQLHRRSRRVRRRVDPGWPADRARRREPARASSEKSPGNPLVADYVFTQPGVRLAGRRVAEGTAAHLVLWQVGGPVRVVGAPLGRAAPPERLRLANPAEVAARVEGDQELLPPAIDLELVRSARGRPRSPRGGPGAGPCGSARCSSPRRSGSTRQARAPRRRRARPRRGACE